MLENDYSIKTVTKYIDPKMVIRVSRRFKPQRRSSRYEFVVTIGAPNYLAVKFIKLCKKAGEPFPVKKIQISYYAKETAESKAKAIAKKIALAKARREVVAYMRRRKK